MFINFAKIQFVAEIMISAIPLITLLSQEHVQNRIKTGTEIGTPPFFSFRNQCSLIEIVCTLKQVHLSKQFFFFFYN